MTFADTNFKLKLHQVDVVEEHARARRGALRCETGEGKILSFSTEGIESYCFASWEPVVFDALLVAAAVEFCDRAFRRSALSWGRKIRLTIPVHDLHRWRAPEVRHALVDALTFLTGDRWLIQFKARKVGEPPRRQGQIPLPTNAKSVMPFSDGLDSWSVATLIDNQPDTGLLRVRRASNGVRHRAITGKHAFAVVPFDVRAGKHRLDQTVVRSRGFKFALISGIAAYLAKVEDAIIPESGQRALGSALVPVGQAYPDYRSHPLFMKYMERLFAVLLSYDVRYRFPRLWSTKGETLRDAIACERQLSPWIETRSCWQSKRWASVDGNHRQCGICASCLLRRLSVYSAGQTEPAETYVWENLRSSAFEAGAASSFIRFNSVHRNYAIAGTLHLDHLAGMTKSPDRVGVLKRNALLLSRALGKPLPLVEVQLARLIEKHEAEWKDFVGSLGPRSFVSQWAQAAA